MSLNTLGCPLTGSVKVLKATVGLAGVTSGETLVVAVFFVPSGLVWKRVCVPSGFAPEMLCSAGHMLMPSNGFVLSGVTPAAAQRVGKMSPTQMNWLLITPAVIVIEEGVLGVVGDALRMKCVVSVTETTVVPYASPVPAKAMPG